MTPEPRTPIRVDPDDPHGSAGVSEAITERPDLGFERKAEAKWLGDVMGMRLMAVALARRARGRRGEALTPIPWLAIAVTFGLVAAIIVLGWGVASLLG